MPETFFEAVLPRSGHYAVFTLGNKRHHWADSLAQLERQLALHWKEQGTYFATASFSEPTQRTQANVLALRSLRLDIDAGEKKHAANPEGTYPTQQAAIKALIDFTGATGLAPSFIVSSGEGLHVYYALDEDLPPARWVPLAKRLAALCAAHELRVDPTVTTDTARILRPPGFLHPNGTRVEVLKSTGRVHSAANLDALLPGAGEPDEDDPFAGAEGRFGAGHQAINEDVTRIVEGPPKSIHKVVERCGAVRVAAAAGGDVPEPYWRAMLGIVKFTVEGVEMAHELSRGYDGYDPSETEKKFNAWAAGPTSCAEFSKHSVECASCPHNGKIKSPIQLGVLTDQQVAELPPELQPKEPAPVVATGLPWDGVMPPRFSVIAGPGPGQYTLQYIMKITKDNGDGTTSTTNMVVPVTHDIFWFEHWSEALDSKDKAQVSVHVYKHGKVRSFLMDQGMAAGQFDLLKWLAEKSVHATPDKKAGQAMIDYAKLQLQRIHALMSRPKINGRFGLRIAENGDLTCAHGAHLIMPDGRIEEALLSDELAASAHCFALPLPPSETGEWGADVWKTITPRAAEYAAYMRSQYGSADLAPYQLAVMLGLASPLMAFVTGSYTQGVDLPPNALSVSLYSRGSGLGKTALVAAIMLAYGHPERLVQEANKAGSTDIARLERLSVWGTFPTSMDEMGQTSESSITNMISAVANAKGKARAKQGGGFTVTKSWALINLITTNRSQREMISAGKTDESSAIQYRLLELDVEGVEFTREAREAYADAWAKVQATTKGAMGAVIARALCRLGAARLNEEMLKAVKEADRYLQADQGARFQYRALGAVLFLQKVLTALKLDMFDTDTLKAAFKRAYESGVEYIADTAIPDDPAIRVGMMLNDLKPKTLITANETDRRVDKTAVDMPLNSRVPDAVEARHVVGLGITYLTATAFADWCTLNKVDARRLIKECRERDILEPFGTNTQVYVKQHDLFRGTREAGTAWPRCYRINTRRLVGQHGGSWKADNVVPIAGNGATNPSDEESDSTPKENAS